MPKYAIDYSKTIIYQIECKDSNVLDKYTGSTTSFPKRESGHASACNNEKDKKYNLLIYQTIRANGGWENWLMVQIERYPCADSNEAFARERDWQDALNTTMNSQKAQRSKAEYYLDNREEILAKGKEYYLDNKEQISEKNKEYYEEHHEQLIAKQIIYNQANSEKIKERNSKKYECACGGRYTHQKTKAHTRTKIHIDYVSSQTPELTCAIIEK